jgi:hypothetical protein
MKYGKDSVFYIPLCEIDKFVAKTTQGVYNKDRDELWSNKLPFNYNRYYVECKVSWLTEDGGYACILLASKLLFGVVWFSQHFIDRFNKPELGTNKGSWTPMLIDVYNSCFIGPRNRDGNGNPFYKVWGTHKELKRVDAASPAIPPKVNETKSNGKNPTKKTIINNEAKDAPLLTAQNVREDKQAWADLVNEQEEKRIEEEKNAKEAAANDIIPKSKVNENEK